MHCSKRAFIMYIMFPYVKEKLHAVMHEAIGLIGIGIVFVD